MLDNQKKLISLLKLSECCKVLRKYDESLKFLRKALQYAWHLKKYEIEIYIYDKMGIIYYLIGDLIKARYYHERFIQNKLEASHSPCKLASAQILNKFFEMNHTENYNIYTTSSTQIIPMILAKLSFTAQIDDLNNSILFERKGNGIKEENTSNLFYSVDRFNPKISRAILSTDQNIEIQLQSIFEEKEFLFEIASPRCFYIFLLKFIQFFFYY